MILVAGGVLVLAWLLGISRWIGELGALAGIGAYVLAVGAQPSVVRAGIAGSLASLAWMAGRLRDAWYALLLGGDRAARLEPVSRLRSRVRALVRGGRGDLHAASRGSPTWLEGYPLPRFVRAAVAVSIACGAVTAPILWLQFGALPLLTVPANALAEPAMPVLLALAFVDGRARRRLARRRPRSSRGSTAGSRRTSRSARTRSARFRSPRSRRTAASPRRPAPFSPPPMLGGDGRGAEARLPARRERPPEGRPRARSGCARRFAPDAVELHTAADASGEDVVAAANALGLFAGDGRLIVVDGVEAWKADDAKAIAAYLKAPAPATTLALVADELKKDAPLAKAVAPTGEVLIWEVAKKAVQTWVAEQFKLHGAKADPEACRALIVLVGDDLYELATEIDKLTTWAAGEPITADDRRGARRAARRGQQLRAHRRRRRARPRRHAARRPSSCSSAPPTRARARSRASRASSRATSRASASARRSRPKASRRRMPPRASSSTRSTSRSSSRRRATSPRTSCARRPSASPSSTTRSRAARA